MTEWVLPVQENFKVSFCLFHILTVKNKCSKFKGGEVIGNQEIEEVSRWWGKLLKVEKIYMGQEEPRKGTEWEKSTQTCEWTKGGRRIVKSFDWQIEDL